MGRYVCSFPKLMTWSARRLLTFSVARTLFVPLFLLCNLQRPSDAGIPSSPFINSDFVFMLLLFVFGGSNGYLSSCMMMAAPSLEHNPRLQGRRKDVDVAATVASFCLVGGLVMGSIASFAVRAAVCECNPFIQR
jgi:equilibrative nucleoside transporter 1/2/3